MFILVGYTKKSQDVTSMNCFPSTSSDLSSDLKDLFLDPRTVEVEVTIDSACANASNSTLFQRDPSGHMVRILIPDTPPRRVGQPINPL